MENGCHCVAFLHPPLPLVGVSMRIKRRRQHNDRTLADVFGSLHDAAIISMLSGSRGGQKTWPPVPAPSARVLSF